MWLDLLVSGFVTIIAASCPLIFAGVGELVTEKSGVLNLGVEGMMAVGAVSGFAMTYFTGYQEVGLIASMVAGAGLSLVFCFFTQILLINQVVSGLSLTIFGLGLSALVGQGLVGISGEGLSPLLPEFIREIPVIGKIFFGYNMVVYLAILLPFIVVWFLKRTRLGKELRAVGDNADAAYSIGIRVIRIRSLAIMFGGAMSGLGGGYLSIIYTPLWVENMVAGRGWVAVALVVFAAWRPVFVLLGALLFGGIVIIQLNFQAFGVAIDSQYMSMFPYIATVVVLSLMSRLSVFQQAPRSLGKIFVPD